MLRKLDRRLAAFGFLFTFAVGSLVGILGYLQLTRGVRLEALARVEDAVGVAERLLAEELTSIDPLGESGRAITPEAAAELPEDLRDLVRRVSDRGGLVRSHVLVEGEGLSMAAAAVGKDGVPRVAWRSLRGANWIPDSIRHQVFGDQPQLRGRPTVTIFEGAQRVATNVRQKDGSRAVGTYVSDEVARAVLEGGENWNDRAYVVNRWVLTSYHPLTGPDGRVIGMIYVGLDEAPYLARGRQAAWGFLAVILVLTLLVSLWARLTGKRLARPLGQLVRAANALAHGERHLIEPPKWSSEEVRALTESFNEMAEQVTGRTEALQKSRQATEQALDQYLEVLGFVAHELKSPVAGALTSLNLIEQGYGGKLPETKGHPLPALRRHLDHAQDIALSFNILSKTESAGFALAYQNLENLPRDLFEPALRDLESRARERGIELEMTAPPVPAQVDPGLLRIAFDNLVGNAIKYARPESLVEIALIEEGQQLRLTVRNQGLGVPKENFPDLFRKFSRVGDPGFRTVKGTGLGLYFVGRIAEAHGGSVSVRGDYGQWIEFELRLPRAVNPPPEESVAAS